MDAENITISPEAIKAALDELWGFNYYSDNPVTVTAEEAHKQVEEALRAALPHLSEVRS